MRFFCAGVTRQNRRWFRARAPRAPHRRVSRFRSASARLRSPRRARSQTCAVTSSLSPVSTLTATPSARSAGDRRCRRSPWAGPGRRAKPTKTRSLSSLAEQPPCSARKRLRQATPRTRKSLFAERVKRICASARARDSSSRSRTNAAPADSYRVDSARMSSGAPLTISDARAPVFGEHRYPPPLEVERHLVDLRPALQVDLAAARGWPRRAGS